jgi:Tfp pilus assembly protein PilF
LGARSIGARDIQNIGQEALMKQAVIGLSLTIAAATGALLIAAVPFSAAAQDTAQRLGTVHFPTSCNETAQRRFDRGMRYQHSFWYSQSKEIFEDVLKADPKCVIAYWGIGQSLLANPFNPTPAKNLGEGLAALTKAKEIGAGTPREADLIAALTVYYTDYDKLDQRTRVLAYAKAMEAVAGRYRDDEVQIYYALALDVAAPPSDKTYANQLKAAAILEPIFQRQPHHPGVAHYLIHTYDYPALAQKGIDAALRYAAIAEAAPHAQHMPSHIFTRVGSWKESALSNATAARLAKQGKEPDDQLHASDYMVYAYLQLGRDREARAVIDEMAGIAGYSAERNTGPFALAASPARYVLERGDWNGAAQLPVAASKFAYTEAMTRFARAVGAARLGRPDVAKSEIRRLAELRDALRAARDAYWAEQVDIQHTAASAWVLFAEGNRDGALVMLARAADAEDKTEKATVTPGPLIPARELYGAMLLASGKAQEALAAFGAVLEKEPRRFGAILGAARAAAAAGDAASARRHYDATVALTEASDGARPEIAEARAYVAKR